MTGFDEVKKLKEYANITYEEAKEVLEQANGDLLDAVIILEKQNRINSPEGVGTFNSNPAAAAPGKEGKTPGNDKTDKISFGDVMGDIFGWVRKIIHKGNVNSFEARKGEERILKIPLNLLAILLIFGMWIVIPLLILGLVFGYRYSFKGPDVNQANQELHKVSEAALQAVESVSDAAKKAVGDYKNKKDHDENGKNSDY